MRNSLRNLLQDEKVTKYVPILFEFKIEYLHIFMIYRGVKIIHIFTPVTVLVPLFILYCLGIVVVVYDIISDRNILVFVFACFLYYLFYQYL